MAKHQIKMQRNF